MNNKSTVWDLDLNDFQKKSTPKEKICFLLNYAILAPSTHNTQPWKFKVRDSECEIFVDNMIQLKQADPLGRNLYISFGCLIENLYQVSSYFNVYDKVEYYFDNDTSLIARVKFKNLEDSSVSLNKAHKYLVNAITHWFTYRGIFEKKGHIGINQTESIEGVYVQKIDDRQLISKLADLTRLSVKKIASKREFRSELSNWMNSNVSTRTQGIPGYAYGFPLLASLVTPYLMASLDPSNMMANKSFKTALSASAVFVILTKSDSPKNWLLSGRLTQRHLLDLTSKGIRVSINVASIQDSKSHVVLAKMLNTKDVPQFIFFAGFTSMTRKPTPRRSLEEMLI